MIRARPLPSLLGVLLLTAGCLPLAETAPSPVSPDDLPACYAVFPARPWESVHRIEAFIGEGASSSLIGVTRGNPSERTLHCLLLTPEGFTLFEAEFRDIGISVKKAVAPFDSPVFARGLMEDVTFLFLPPLARPTGWGKSPDGSRVCRWEGPDGSRIELRLSVDRHGSILRWDARGELTKEAVLLGPFCEGLASSVELRAFRPAPYRLRMTLLRPAQ